MALAACSSGSTTESDAGDTETATEDTTSTTDAPEATTTTTEPAATTSPAESGDLASCVVGTWELDLEALSAVMFDSLAPAAAGADLTELTFEATGTDQVTMSEDGTWTETRDNTFAGSAAEGAYTMVIAGTGEGTWSVSGEQISVTSTQTDMTMTMTASSEDGEFTVGPRPVERPAGDPLVDGAFTATCGPDDMIVDLEGGFTSTFTRVAG